MPAAVVLPAVVLDLAARALTPAQHTFCLEYLNNGFNATQAHLTAHPTAALTTCATEGHRTLRLPKILAFLNPQLEAAWKPLQMGGEQALARVAILAGSDRDSRVRLAALRTILEQTGKLKSLPAAVDELAEAIKADIARHTGQAPA